MSNAVAPFQLLELNVISAQDLAPVARSMRTYAIAWVHPDRKLSTRTDTNGHNSPTWNDKFVFRVDDEFLYADTSAIMVEIYALHWFRDIHVGTVRVLVANLIPESGGQNAPSRLGLRFVALQVRRPSGRPQGILNVGVAVLDSSMRSMPLYTHNASALGYQDLMGEKDNAHDHHNPSQVAHLVKPELRRSKSDNSSMISAVVESRRQRTSKGKKGGKASSVISHSDVSPEKKKKSRSKQSRSKSSDSGSEHGKKGKPSSVLSDSVLSWPAGKEAAAAIVSGSGYESPTMDRNGIQQSPIVKNSPVVKNSPAKNRDGNEVNDNDHMDNIVFAQRQSLLSSSTETTSDNSFEKFATHEKSRPFLNTAYEVKASPHRNSEAPKASPFHNAAGPRASPFHRAVEPRASPYYHAADPRASPHYNAGEPRASPFHNAARGSPFHNAARASPFQNAAGPKASPFHNAAGPRESPFRSAAAGPRASPFQNAAAGPRASPFHNAAAGPRASPYRSLPAQKFIPAMGAVGYGGSHRGTPKATPLHPSQFGKFNPAIEYGTPRRSNLANLAPPPFMTESELGPSPSDVAAAIAKQPPPEEGEASTVGGWSLDESVEGLRSKLDRWQTEVPPVYEQGGEFSSFPTTITTSSTTKSSSHSRRHTEPANGLFSCFSNICGCECSIVCGGDKKKKKSRRRTPSVDNTSFS